MKQLLTLLLLCCSAACFALTPISGPGSVCLHDSISLYDATSGGVWTVADPSVAIVGSASGKVAGVGVGTTTISYTSGGVTVTHAVIVNGLPAVYATDGGGRYCPGGTGVSIGLTGSNTGINYQLYEAGAVSGGVLAGTGAPVSFGLRTTAGSYMAVATSTVTGCSDTMTGRPVVSIASFTIYSLVYGTGAYCIGSPGIDLSLSGSDTGAVYMLYDGSTVVSSMPGTGAALDFGIRVSGTYAIVAYYPGLSCTADMSGTAIIYIAPPPTVYGVTGSGVYCAGSTGAVIGLSDSDPYVRYQLYLGGSPIGSPVDGFGGFITFAPQTTLGTYTVIATNIAAGCTDTMAGSVTVFLSPLPAVDTVTGGGSYCFAGTGVHIGVRGTVSGVSYQPFIGTTPVGSPVAGTGSPIDFGLETSAGTYTVVGTSTTTGCAVTMYDSVGVTILPPPAAFAVTGGDDTLCAGSTGAAVGLAGSATGVYYQLYRGTTAVGSHISGIGSRISFGLETVTGTYTVVATNATTGCTATMTDSAIVVVNPLPAAYTVTGGGTYCAGSPGAPIGLSGSQTGIDYQLLLVTTAVGSAVPGTGSALSFGLEPAGSIYAVAATNPLTGCTTTMTGSVTIIMVASPSGIGRTSDSLCIMGTTTYTDAVSGGRWHSGNELIASVDSMTGDISGVAAGTTHITYTLADGCPAVDTIIVYACTSLGAAGIDHADEITISPNPASASCTIAGITGTYTTASVTIYDITGRQLHSYPLTGEATTISLADLAPGMYICHIAIDGKEVVSKKIVIQR